MATNPYPSQSSVPGAPSSRAFAITPGSGELPFITSAIYVGTGGDITLRPFRSDADVIYRNVPSGAYLTIRASRVSASGTTASDLVGEV